MEITLEKKDVTNATLKVNLKQEDYQPKVSEKVRQYSKKANLKGFRPGKVPTAMIEKMYGKSILVDEINNLLSSTISNYIRENKLPIIGDPLPNMDQSKKIDWDTQKEFEFNYEIGLVSDFSYDLSKNVKLKGYKITAEENVVNETLENLRNQYGKNSNPEVSEEGDFIYGELKKVGGEVLSSGMIHLKKINKDEVSKFVGKKKDDQITFDIRKTLDDVAVRAQVSGLSTEEAEKLEGEYEFTIKNINRSEASDIDQEFFDKLFGKDTVKTEEEFRAKLKETIQENYQRESETLLNKEAQETLTNNTNIDLPKEFLKKWLLIRNGDKITPEQIEKDFEFYLKELKWNLIKNKIAEDNELKVEDAEIKERTKKMIMQQFGGAGLSPEMDEALNGIADNYLKQENGKNYSMVYEQTLIEKIIAIIKEKVNVEEKAVSVEEFKKIAGF